MQASTENHAPETKENLFKIAAAHESFKEKCHPSPRILHLCSKMSSLEDYAGQLACSTKFECVLHLVFLARS